VSANIPAVWKDLLTYLPSNRKGTPDATPLLLDSIDDESVPTWAAARCTSAAAPWIEAFAWKGRALLDGGYQVNCPAASAFVEAKCIWPEKRCDAVVSLGTGKPEIDDPQTTHTVLRLLEKAATQLTGSEATWSKFSATFTGPMERHGIFRLQPTYKGRGFEFDDFKKLSELESEVEAWLMTCDEQIRLICDRLVAALFFFTPLSSITNGDQSGEIRSRLPVDLDARNTLIDAMLQHRGMDLFRVEFIGTARETLSIAAPHDLTLDRKRDELRIPVQLSALPSAGKIEIDIRMRNVNRNVPPSHQPWSPISGSPYVLRGRIEGTSENGRSTMGYR
jgi:hypothetical protein